MPLGVVQHGLQLIEVCESGYAVGPQHRQRAARTSEKVRRYLSSKSRVVSVKPYQQPLWYAIRLAAIPFQTKPSFPWLLAFAEE